MYSWWLFTCFIKDRYLLTDELQLGFCCQGASPSSSGNKLLHFTVLLLRAGQEGATHTQVQTGSRRSGLKRGTRDRERKAECFPPSRRLQSEGERSRRCAPRCQPLLGGGMGRGEGASSARVSSPPSVNCYLETIRLRSWSERLASTLKKLPSAGAAGGCYAMEIKTRLRAVLMFMWISQGKLINSLERAFKRRVLLQAALCLHCGKWHLWGQNVASRESLWSFSSHQTPLFIQLESPDLSF